MDYNRINRLADKQLVEKVLQGDRPAFNLLVKNTERLVGQIVARMIGGIEDRKDIIQDIYLNTFRHLRGFRYEAKLSTWIGNIAYNTCVNFLQKRKLLLMGDDFPPENISAGDGDQAESMLSNKQLTLIIGEKVQGLPPVYRTLIILYHQEELSYADIAQIMSMPEGTVKSYLFRARRQLKDSILADYKKEEL